MKNITIIKTTKMKIIIKTKFNLYKNNEDEDNHKNKI